MMNDLVSCLSSPVYGSTNEYVALTVWPTTKNGVGWPSGLAIRSATTIPVGSFWLSAEPSVNCKVGATVSIFSGDTENTETLLSLSCDSSVMRPWYVGITSSMSGSDPILVTTAELKLTVVP